MDFKEYHGKVFLNSRDSFCSDFFEVNMFDTVNNKGILPFKLNTTYRGSFVFWGRFFLYCVDFEICRIILFEKHYLLICK